MSIKNRIQKLLNQAADQEGTPEGDTFQQKAMELLARYGLTEFDVREDNTDGNEMVVANRHVVKHYTIEHQTLYHAVAYPLGVFVVRVPKSTELGVVGTRNNIDRVDLLYASLSLQMWKGALKLSSKIGEQYTTQQKRRSYCYSYASQIMDRLIKVEKRVRDEVAAEGVLVPVNEYDEAERFFRQNGGRNKRATSHARTDQDAVAQGRRDANQADLGQSRVRGRKALA